MTFETLDRCASCGSSADYLHAILPHGKSTKVRCANKNCFAETAWEKTDVAAMVSWNKKQRETKNA